MDDWNQGIPLSYTRKLAAGRLEARCLHRGQGRPGEHCTTTEYTSLPHRHRGLLGRPARWHVRRHPPTRAALSRFSAN